MDKNTQNLQWCQHHFQCRHHCSCRNRPWCRHQWNQSKCSIAGVAFGGIPEIRHRHGTIAGIAPPLVLKALEMVAWDAHGIIQPFLTIAKQKFRSWTKVQVLKGLRVISTETASKINLICSASRHFKLGSFLILRNEPNLNLTGPFH